MHYQTIAADMIDGILQKEQYRTVVARASKRTLAIAFSVPPKIMSRLRARKRSFTV